MKIGIAYWLAFGLILTMLCLGLFPILLISMNHEDYPYVLFSIVPALVIVVAIFLHHLVAGQQIDIFSPVFGMLFVVALGASLRAPYMIAYADSSPAAQYLLLGFSFSDVNENIDWFLVGVLALLAGYYSTRWRFRLEKLAAFANNEPSARRLLLGCIMYSLIACVGIVGYVSANGIDLSQGILAASSKKALTFDAEGEIVYGAGYQTFIGQFSSYPLILVSSGLLLRILPMSGLWISICALLAMQSVIIPVLGNTRSAIIVIGLTILMTLFYFGRLRLKIVMVWLVTSLSLIVVLTELRIQSQQQTNTNEGLVDTFLSSGNGLDSLRTSLIIKLVPERAPFQYGKTFAGVVSLFIPRSLWPSKPNTALGPWVKSEIFGRDVRINGWPPGVIAEGYINFGYVGIFVVPYLYGLLLRLYYNSFRPLLGHSIGGTIIYTSGLYPLCFAGISNNVALGVVGAVYAIGPLFLLSLFAFGRESRTEDSGSEVEHV